MGAMDLDGMDDDVLIEYHVEGNFVRVSAMDAATLTEVTIIGDRRAGRETLKRTVMAKLDYVLANQKPDPKPRRPGLWV